MLSGSRTLRVLVGGVDDGGTGEVTSGDGDGADVLQRLP